jgi:hypothetical protein
LADQQTGESADRPIDPPIIPLAPWCIAQIKRKLHERGAERKKENPQDRLARRTANATVAIAFLTFVVGAVGALQYFTFQGQLDVMKGQLDAMEADQRPWIGITGLGPHQRSPRPIPGNDFYVFVNVSNVGKAPAFHAHGAFQAEFLNPNEKPAIPPAECSYCGDGDVMLPGVPLSRTPHVNAADLTPQAIAQIAAGNASIWVSGRVDYRDGASKPHKTFMCYQFGADGSFISCNIPGSNYAD